jgi:hypothetical protein
MSPRISIGPEPVLAAHARPRLQLAATARREKVQLPIREQMIDHHRWQWRSEISSELVNTIASWFIITS